MIDATVEEIQDMQTHSSSEVALKGVRALRSVAEGDHATVEEFVRSLERNCRTLRSADPSHAMLYSTTNAIQAAVDAYEPGSIEEARQKTHEAIDDQIERIEMAKHEAAENAASVIDPGGSYMTLDYSTTVHTAFAHHVAGEDETTTVYALEARPRFLGRKMARRLATIDSVEAHLAVDNASGHFLPSCDAVVLGMTCIVEDTLYNRVGTNPLVHAANAVDVPVYVLGADMKLVGEQFVFSEDRRPSSEVSLEPIDDVVIENPAYDATAIERIESVITDAGNAYS